MYYSLSIIITNILTLGKLLYFTYCLLLYKLPQSCQMIVILFTHLSFIISHMYSSFIDDEPEAQAGVLTKATRHSL